MLAYEICGSGVPLVLLHAFPLSSAMWKPEARALEEIAQVILPDLPGFGRSPRQTRPSIPGMAEAVAQLLDSLKIKDPVFIGGLSMGGYVAFEFLRQFPQRVRGLGLFSTRAAADTSEGREKRMQTIQKIQSEGLPAFTEKVVLNLLGKTTLETKPEVVRYVKEMILNNQAEGVTDALLAMAERRDSTELLQSIQCPTLAIAGEEDSFVPLKEAESFAKQIPGVEFRVMKKAGHLANLENPPAFRSLLKDFLLSKIVCRENKMGL